MAIRYFSRQYDRAIERLNVLFRVAPWFLPVIKGVHGVIEAKAADWSMQVANEIKGRLQELAAKIAAETDHDRFTALVKEFNTLVDEPQGQKTRSRFPTPH